MAHLTICFIRCLTVNSQNGRNFSGSYEQVPFISLECPFRAGLNLCRKLNASIPRSNLKGCTYVLSVADRPSLPLLDYLFY